MRIYRIEVENFRGIRTLDWNIRGDFNCLIGPGDSTKTTILDAIELVLSPRWTVPFSDNDFHGADTRNPIQITATIGGLPAELLSDEKLGLYVRGRSGTGEVHDEPEDDDEPVLIIRLRVDESLDPEWLVINDRLTEDRLVSARDREAFRCTRLGTLFDRHFAWGKGSTLTRLTAGADDVSQMLAEAGRAARRSMGEQPEVRMPNLQRAAERVQAAGGELGVAPRETLRPLLDVEAVTLGVGGLSLHDGNVPVRRAGLGTRRLLAIAMQRAAGAGGSVTLLDELELGLEPHRLRRAIRALRPEARSGRQVFTTTHSPTAIQELEPAELSVVRNTTGAVSVSSVPSVLRPIVLRASEALLARRVIVCEGRSEIGFCRGMDAHWSEDGVSFGRLGVALSDGAGASASQTALAIAGLGYAVALLGDSDVPQEPSPDELRKAGAEVLLWDGNVALEQRIALDLPWAGVAAMLDLAFEHLSPDAERQAIASRLGVTPALLDGASTGWPSAELPEQALREAIGATAKNRNWFKRVDLAEALASVVVPHLDAIPGTDLARKIATLRDWTRADE